MTFTLQKQPLFIVQNIYGGAGGEDLPKKKLDHEEDPKISVRIHQEGLPWGLLWVPPCQTSLGEREHNFKSL